MTLKHTMTVWLIRQGIRLAWAVARVVGRLGEAGGRLEVRLDAVAAARPVDMLDVLAPLAAPLRMA
jgi:hypothetical protein